MNKLLDVWLNVLSYEATSTKFTRDLVKELIVCLVASVFMGFGVLFLLLWVGIYVWNKMTYDHVMLQLRVYISLLYTDKFIDGIFSTPNILGLSSGV